MNNSKEIDSLLNAMQDRKKIFYKELKFNADKNNVLFNELGTLMLGWAKNFLGDNYITTLIDGYASFVLDVNRSQLKYEMNKKYINKTYEDVYRSVYNNPAHMELYHWGVFLTTFAWEHHLRIFDFFIKQFLINLNENGKVLDLGSGSGIWSLLLLQNFKNWTSTGIDISETSVNTARKMADVNGFEGRAVFLENNALTYLENQKFNAVISAFLLEHLEDPREIFSNISSNLEPHGYAFVTGALTAAEVDHIYEFRRESEIIRMAEDAGLRLVSCLSSAPRSHPTDMYFLPRSMAMVFQKRNNEIW
jgi:2-polyprenyl-3-methyl-5-hydroxy-6-metoxy-1,4-benzoquinol methylase